MKTLGLASAMLVASCSLASAAGINLSWNDCGLGGQPLATFNCGSNTGAPFIMIASFDPPPGLNEFLGLQAQIDITSLSATLPDWWQFGPIYCRGSNGLTTSEDFTSGPFTCADFWGGQAAGGWAYDVGFLSPNRARLLVQAAVPFANRGPVSPGTEYYGFKVVIQRSKSTSPGACAGCQDPMCIVLNEMVLYQTPSAGFDPVLTNPLNQNWVTWQAGSVPGCPQSTPTRSATWGRLKSMYR